MTTVQKPVPPMPVEPTTTGGPGLYVPEGYTFHNANDIQTIRDIASCLAASQAENDELKAIIRRDMGEDYLSLQALYVQQLGEVRRLKALVEELAGALGSLLGNFITPCHPGTPAMKAMVPVSELQSYRAALSHYREATR